MIGFILRLLLVIVFFVAGLAATTLNQDVSNWVRTHIVALKGYIERNSLAERESFRPDRRAGRLVAATTQDDSDTTNDADTDTDNDYVASGRSVVNDRRNRKGEELRYGVLRNDHAEDAGETLYTNGRHGAVLINTEGTVLHRWEASFSDVWKEGEHKQVESWQVDDKYIIWCDAKALPDGSLYVVLVRSGMRPWGFGLMKLDRNSRPVWKLDANVHHWISLSPDQKTVLAMEHLSESGPLNEEPYGRETDYLNDYVVLLDADTGAIKKRYMLTEAFARSDYKPMLLRTRGSDVTHANSIKYVTAEQAKNIPHAQEGDILVSIRNLNTVVIIDKDTDTVKWMFYGRWFHQHDTDLENNGNLVMFDNFSGDHFRSSRILETHPVTQEITWEFAGSDDIPSFFSGTRGHQQVLPNNNVMITESIAGHIFEITREGKLVWDFYSPEAKEFGEGMIAPVASATRYEPGYFTFLEK